MKTLLNPRIIRTGLLLAGVALSASLGWASWSVHGGIQEAADVVSHGQGSLLLESVRAALHEHIEDSGPPDSDTLAEILANHQDDGTQYIALVGADGMWLHAGKETLGGQAPFMERGGVGRIVFMAPQGPGLRGGPHGPHGPPGPGAGAGPQRAHPNPAADAEEHPGPGLLRGDRGAPPAIVLEFAATMASQLRGRAQKMLVIGLLGALLAAVGTLVFWWMLLQREIAAEALDEHTRLAALGQMSATMAHEIRNPLTSAKGHAQLLVELLEEGRAKDKAGQVVRELVRLEELTNDLLTFIRSGKVADEAVDPVQLLRDAAGRVGGDIDIVNDRAPAHFNLDPDRIGRVLVNVLRNAINAGGRAVKISARVAMEGDTLVYELRDHGPGIPLELLPTLFDPFVTSRVTGLGLAISRQIVEAHNGTIVAHNHPDGGAVITVRLPRT